MVFRGCVLPLIANKHEDKLNPNFRKLDTARLLCFEIEETVPYTVSIEFQTCVTII